MSDNYAALRETWQQRHEPMVYIAGAYRGDGRDTNRRDNIRAASDMWRALADSGIRAICPHVLSKELDPVNARGDRWWLDYTAALMRMCSAVVRLPNDSPGADAEVRMADALGIPVYQADYFDAVPQLLLDTFGGGTDD